MRKNISLIAISALLLSGCNSLGMKESPLWHKTASIEEKMAYFTEMCRGYGYKDGSDELRDCAVEEQRMSRSAAREKIRNSRTYRPINCTSTSIGRTTSTSCY